MFHGDEQNVATDVLASDSTRNKALRGKQLGVVSSFLNSFEHNQSFPMLPKNKKENRLAKGLNKFTGKEINACTFSQDHLANFNPADFPSVDLEKSFSSCISKSSSRPHSRLSLGGSWSFSSFINASDKINPSDIKPINKAVFTIDAETSQILTANTNACIMFGYNGGFVNVKLTNLLKKPSPGKPGKEALLRDIHDVEGNEVVIAGKVMEAVTKQGDVFAVSVWARKVEANTEQPRCLVILQPVVRVVGKFQFNQQGDILSCDDKFGHIHGYSDNTLLSKLKLQQLMPSYEMPTSSRISKGVRKQQVTSTTLDGQKIPILVYIINQTESDTDVIYSANVWYFTDINGILVCHPCGKIKQINTNFSLALMGYTASEMCNKNIRDVLPDISSSAEPCSIKLDISDDEVALVKACSEDRTPNEQFSATLIEKLSENETLQTSSCEPFEMISNATAGNQQVSSFTHIDFTLSEKQQSTADHINSLLSGSCSESLGSDVDHNGSNIPYKHDLEGNSSWVELTLNEGNPSNAKDKLSQINAALNGSLHSQPTVKDKTRSPDSAVHSSSETTESSSTQENKGSTKSSFSDYHSRDGSPAHVFKSSANTSQLANHPKPNALSKTINITSTPIDGLLRSESRMKSTLDLPLGIFSGQLRHKNNTLIPVTYEIQNDENGQLFYVRISFTTNYSHDPNQTLSSSFNSTLPSLNASAVSGMLDYSLGAAIKQAAEQRNGNVSHEIETPEGNEEWNAMQGKFKEYYDVIRTIGNGAFGFVRMAKRRIDGKKVIVKFIRKEKVLDDCWVDDYEREATIPLEISLLFKFNHPHIVEVVEFFENENFFSMIMPTHGTQGFDLFEFIDREPKLDEALASYIFRQVVSAVNYLHQQGVVHRDIKDENVIIDECFHCKLIDFGSAAFFEDGKKFSTFCGTIEYCSPEVLLGNSYKGPELEMWALGVTLYTLVFGENPFLTAEDTIEAILKPPNRLSDELMFIIQWLLQPVPEHRCTMYDLLEDPWLNIIIDPKEYNWEDVVPSAGQKDVSYNGAIKPKMDDDCVEDFDSDDNEPLANQVKCWVNEHKKFGLKHGKMDPSGLDKDENIFPLTRCLENINLNHSI
uniref:PAS domain-containing serine/threonine-protein kinase n=1 Tax=Ciona intestinalis TaxID=7719 RepID=F6WPV3_CIOIN|nr:PAS domain-containing serine/threonine-protein kinase isoform X2 [Ciona intestinalis]|eukprot:XP_018670506.1 PAS domain-containing serine/threonine-protein kinase isoform X2 [Ciona intestinalis]